MRVSSDASSSDRNRASLSVVSGVLEVFCFLAPTASGAALSTVQLISGFLREKAAVVLWWLDSIFVLFFIGLIQACESSVRISNLGRLRDQFHSKLFELTISTAFSIVARTRSLVARNHS